MVSAILGQVTGQLERNFLLNAFFPMLVFALAVGLAVAVGTGGTAPAIAVWEQQDTATKVLLTIAAVGLVFLLANLLSNGMLLVIKLYEGYLPPARWVAPWARNRQMQRGKQLYDGARDGLAAAKGMSEGTEKERKRAEVSAAEDALQKSFPVPPAALTADKVAPTRLGNILLSAETYSADRYGVDAVRMWPRLYTLLPATLTDSLAAARDSMEFLLSVSFLSAVYTPAASIYLITASASLPWVLGTLAISAAISWASYVAALGPAGVYGEMVRTAFDLHRLDLFRQLRVPMPATPEEERQRWDDVTRLLDRGEPYPGLTYELTK